MEVAYSWTGSGFSLARLVATVNRSGISGSLAVAMGDYGFPPFWSDWHPRVSADARQALIYIAYSTPQGMVVDPSRLVARIPIAQEQGQPLDVYPLAGSFVTGSFFYEGTLPDDAYLAVQYANAEGQMLPDLYYVPYVIAVDEPDIGDDPVSVTVQTTERAVDRIADLFGDLAAQLGVDPYQLMIGGLIAVGVLVLVLALR